MGLKSQVRFEKPLKGYTKGRGEKCFTKKGIRWQLGLHKLSQGGVGTPNVGHSAEKKRRLYRTMVEPKTSKEDQFNCES